jgi:hypothetical protein
MKETQPTEPVLREPIEVQRAHDLLAQLVLNEHLFFELIEDESDRHCLVAALDALCWMLGHHHNQVFPKNLAYLEGEMVARGYVLTDAGKLIWPPLEAS